MSGDGVSLQTNLVQLGNVAKTQPRNQQAPAGGPAFADQLNKHDELRPQRVQEAEKADKQHIDPDKKRERDQKQRAATDDDAADLEEETADGTSPDTVGRLIDTKA